MRSAILRSLFAVPLSVAIACTSPPPSEPAAEDVSPPPESAATAVDPSSVKAPAQLAGTRWRLTELPREEGFAVDPELEAHLVLDAEAGRVSGSSGCNRLVGTFTQDGDALSFGSLAGTRMACPEPAMELERRFHAALEAVTGYALEGEVLTLQGPDGPLARFERHPE